MRLINLLYLYAQPFDLAPALRRTSVPYRGYGKRNKRAKLSRINNISSKRTKRRPR